VSINTFGAEGVGVYSLIVARKLLLRDLIRIIKKFKLI
jgi:hypothetical protein